MKKDIFPIITLLTVWFFEWEFFISLLVDLWWLFSDHWIIFWIRVALTLILILVWLYLRSRPEREKSFARRKIP